MLALGDIDAVHLAKVALAAPLFLVLPGYLLLRLILGQGSVTDPPVFVRHARGTSDVSNKSLDGPPAPSFLERWFLHMALSVGVVATSAILLAEVGWFGLDSLLVVVGGTCAGLAIITRRMAPVRSPQDDVSLAPVLALGMVLILTVALFLPAYPTVLAASDSTVYLNGSSQ